MLKLLKKEFILAMHPTTPFMILFSAMVLIPSYPYSVMFFYVSMAIFFTCLLGRENNDITYSLMLPVRKKDVVKARIGFASIVQLLQLLVMIVMVILRQQLNISANPAGMEANISLFAIGFTIYGIFNLIFFISYYKNVNKVGISFVKSSIVIFLCVVVEVISCYVVTFVKELLDTADPLYLKEKLIFLTCGILIYIICTFIAYTVSVKNFEKQDLSL